MNNPVEEETRFSKIKTRILNIYFLSYLLIFGLVIISVASFTNALTDLNKFFSNFSSEDRVSVRVSSAQSDQFPGISILKFTFADCPDKFHVKDLVLHISDIGPELPISSNPSKQVVAIKVSKVISQKDFAGESPAVLIETNFYADDTVPYGLLEVHLAYESPQTRRKFKVLPEFMDVHGNTIEIREKMPPLEINIANYAHVFATEATR